MKKKRVTKKKINSRNKHAQEHKKIMLIGIVSAVLIVFITSFIFIGNNLVGLVIHNEGSASFSVDVNPTNSKMLVVSMNSGSVSVDNIYFSLKATSPSGYNLCTALKSGTAVVSSLGWGNLAFGCDNGLLEFVDNTLVGSAAKSEDIPIATIELSADVPAGLSLEVDTMIEDLFASKFNLDNIGGGEEPPPTCDITETLCQGCIANGYCNSKGQIIGDIDENGEVNSADAQLVFGIEAARLTDSCGTDGGAPCPISGVYYCNDGSFKKAITYDGSSACSLRGK